MKKNSVEPESKIKPVGKTDWGRVIEQTNSEIVRNANLDSDSSILNDKKYYKPEKSKK